MRGREGGGREGGWEGKTKVTQCREDRIYMYMSMYSIHVCLFTGYCDQPALHMATKDLYCTAQNAVQTFCC